MTLAGGPTNTTPAPASWLATAVARSAVQASSGAASLATSTTSCSPRSPPAALIASIAASTPARMPAPSSASAPVIGTARCTRSIESIRIAMSCDNPSSVRPSSVVASAGGATTAIRGLASVTSSGAAASPIRTPATRRRRSTWPIRSAGRWSSTPPAKRKGPGTRAGGVWRWASCTRAWAYRRPHCVKCGRAPPKRAAWRRRTRASTWCTAGRPQRSVSSPDRARTARPWWNTAQ